MTYATFATGAFRHGAVEVDQWGKLTDNIRWFTSAKLAREWAQQNFTKFALLAACW